MPLPRVRRRPCGSTIGTLRYSRSTVTHMPIPADLSQRLSIIVLCDTIKNMHSSVLPIFRSDSLLAVLDAVLGTPDPVSTSDVIRVTGLSQPLAHRELKRLTETGLFLEKRIGRSALFQADESNPAVSHLRALTAIVLGPQNHLARALKGIPGIECSLIFGSFAARASGVPGGNPNDIDLLIVGNPDRRAVYGAIEGLEGVVGREVNISFVRPERWASGEDELVQRVKANPTLELAVA